MSVTTEYHYLFTRAKKNYLGSRPNRAETRLVVEPSVAIFESTGTPPMNATLKFGCSLVLVIGIGQASAWGQAVDARKDLEDAANKLAFYGHDFDANPTLERLKFLRANYDRLANIRKRNYDRKEV